MESNNTNESYLMDVINFIGNEAETDNGLTKDALIEKKLESEGYDINKIQNCIKSYIGELDDSSSTSSFDLDLLSEKRFRDLLELKIGSTLMNTSGGSRNFHPGAIARDQLSKSLTLKEKYVQAATLQNNDSVPDLNLKNNSQKEGVERESTEHVKRDKLLNKYWKSYVDLRNIGLRMFLKEHEREVAKKFVEHQLTGMKDNFIYHVQHTTNKSRGDWGGGNISKTTDSAYAAWGHSGDKSSLIDLDVAWGSQNFNNEPKKDQWGISYYNENSQRKHEAAYQVYIVPSGNTITYQEIYEPDNASGTTIRQGSIKYSTILERSKQYQRDDQIISDYENATLSNAASQYLKNNLRQYNLEFSSKHPSFELDRKLRNFGLLLGVSACAYTLRRACILEKKLSGNITDLLILSIKKREGLKTLGTFISNSAQNEEENAINKLKNSSNRKTKAKITRVWAAEATVLNHIEKIALINSERVYKRAEHDGFNEQNAFKAANLTFFSDLVLFDTFILNSPSRYLKLGFTNIDHQISYYAASVLPIVIEQERHISKLLLHEEKTFKFLPKYSKLVFDYEVIKYRAIDDIAKASYNNLKQYLGFHPIKQTLRFTKDKVVLPAEKIFSDAFPMFKFGVGAKFGKFVNFVGFSLVKGVVHLPKHIYKDTKELGKQLGKLFSGNATWSGVKGGVWRDIKGPIKAINFVGSNILIILAPELYLTKWGKRRIAKDISVGHLVADAWDYEWKKSKIDAALLVHKLNDPLHKYLHRISDGILPSPAQRFEAKHLSFSQEIDIIKRMVSNRIEVITKDIQVKLVNKMQQSGYTKAEIESKAIKDSITLQMDNYIEYKGKKYTSKDLNSLLKARISSISYEKLMSTNLSKKSATKFLKGIITSSSFSSNFGDWCSNQINEFHREVKIYEAAFKHKTDFKKLAVILKTADKMNTFLANERNSISNQIKTFWYGSKNKGYGGDVDFARMFNRPIGYTLNHNQKKWAKNYEKTNNPGLKIFSDILIAEKYISIKSNISKKVKALHDEKLGLVDVKKLLNSKYWSNPYYKSIILWEAWDKMYSGRPYYGSTLQAAIAEVRSDQGNAYFRFYLWPSEERIASNTLSKLQGYKPEMEKYYGNSFFAKFNHFQKDLSHSKLVFPGAKKVYKEYITDSLDALKLMHPETLATLRKYEERIKITLRIGSIKINQALVEKIKSATIKTIFKQFEEPITNEIVRLSNNSSINRSKLVKEYGDLKSWWITSTSHKWLYTRWKKRVIQKAKPGNVFQSLLDDVSDIKSGQTLTITQIVASLKPEGRDWKISLLPQPNPAQKPISIHFPDIETPHKMSKQIKNSLNSVNLFAYYHQIVASKKIIKATWNKLTGKKPKDIAEEADQAIFKRDVKREAGELSESLTNDLEREIAEAESDIYIDIAETTSNAVANEVSAVTSGVEREIVDGFDEALVESEELALGI